MRQAMRSQNSLLKAGFEQNLIGKRLLGRPRWEDEVKKNLEALVEPNRKILYLNRDDWRTSSDRIV